MALLQWGATSVLERLEAPVLVIVHELLLKRLYALKDIVKYIAVSMAPRQGNAMWRY